MNIEEKFTLVLAAFVLAIVSSWVPWLAYNIVASILPLPDAEWKQATFFTWLAFTTYFWIKS